MQRYSDDPAQSKHSVSSHKQAGEKSPSHQADAGISGTRLKHAAETPSQEYLNSVEAVTRQFLSTEDILSHPGLLSDCACKSGRDKLGQISDRQGCPRIQAGKEKDKMIPAGKITGEPRNVSAERQNKSGGRRSVGHRELATQVSRLLSLGSLGYYPKRQVQRPSTGVLDRNHHFGFPVEDRL
ncbi:hypothetical protein ABZX51_002066 [Aspergillus tubingensis]|uniref:Uncharacterized protein n=1 Tax=Aspergillus tubingensis (strain CBS 134.48) TaxID=767770 RepID=A0A1L9MXA4_ASPTC|nr:hypothetical protein ASPTUDRAFT_728120 [Aspergillus tubingensis CBS 134.48]